MDISTGKRTARVRRTLTKRTVDALQPAEKPWIAWDDKLTGFGVRIQPSGTKAFIVNYRAGDGCQVQFKTDPGIAFNFDPPFGPSFSK